MPVIKTPLLPFDHFKELKRKAVKAKLARRVLLYQQGKKVKEELTELNKELFAELRSVLPNDVKSVEFEGHQITTLEGSPRRYLDQKTLLESEFKCPHCKKGQTLPAAVLKGAFKMGESPEPTVSVKKIGGKGAEAEDEGEDEE